MLGWVKRRSGEEDAKGGRGGVRIYITAKAKARGETGILGCWILLACV